ncbi:MAG: hypothetical protein QOF77_1961 [Solirubrobacteraceae bacterium]|nr:hypothetical protein [Solirubrobacteraceae bacterium]
MRRSLLGVAVVGAALGGGVVAVPASQASSHREAPNIALDPTADNTDTYAYVSPDAPGSLTIVGDWIPGQVPANGPNFFRFDDRAFYYLNIDDTGDGRTDIRYLFKFKTTLRDPSSAFYATPPVLSVYDKTLNVFQTYDLTRETFTDGKPTGQTVIARDIPVAPSNVGQKTMPNYDALAAQAVKELPGNGKVFAGQRDDPFFVDLGGVFDTIHFRLLTGTAGGGKDDFAGFSTSAIVLQVPKSDVTVDRKPVDSPSSPNAVVGVWASTERQALQVTNADFRDPAPASVATSIRVSCRAARPRPAHGGKLPKRARCHTTTAKKQPNPQVQVSRLGTPLFNEVLNPIPQKDFFNRTAPQDDMANFGKNVLAPTIASQINQAFPVVGAPETDRTDLVQLFLTGFPGLNQFPGRPVAADTLKINLGIPPTTTPSRFGVIGGDRAGYPNGRRLFDDVVDIVETDLGGYLKGGKILPLGDGVDQNDKPFLNNFPYLAAPTSGFDSAPSDRVEPVHLPELPGGPIPAPASP